MGHLLGNAVRFGKPKDIMAAGEGIETVLSLLSLFPALPMAAGLSAAHLAASLVCSFSQKRSRPASNCLIEARKSRLVSFTRPREVLSKLDEASESLFDRRTALLAIVIGDDLLKERRKNAAEPSCCALKCSKPAGCFCAEGRNRRSA
jgi:hypothetical protein